MYSSRSEQTDHRRRFADSGSRHRGSCQDKWEERREFHSDALWDSHHKPGRNGHSSRQTEANSKRSKEHSDSPKRWYSNNGMSRDWSRKSPEGGRSPSPDRYAAGSKKRRLDADDDGHRHRREPEDKMHRRSQPSLSRQHLPKDFHRSKAQKVKKSTDSRQSHGRVEFTFKQGQDSYRPLSAAQFNRGYCERSKETTEQKPRSMKYSPRSSGQPIERADSPSRSPDDAHRHHHHRRHHHDVRTRVPSNEPYEESFKPHKSRLSPTAPEEKSNKGFQRFLDVLNKGVNVDMLTKIVTLNPQKRLNDCPQSTVFRTDSVHGPWSPRSVEEQHGGLQNNYHWREGEGLQQVSSPLLHQRSNSSNERHQSDELMFLHSSNEGQTNDGIRSRSRSPSAIEKKAMIPEDEQRHRQLQDVLQAIGLDLGSEELGQMSTRIQERLYGKKDNDQGCCPRESKQDVSPTNPRRSSSSSNRSTLTGDSCLKNESCSGHRCGTVVQQIQVIQRVAHSENSTRTSVQDCEKFGLKSQESAAAAAAAAAADAAMETFSTTDTDSVAEPPFTLLSGMYCSHQLFSASPPALSPSFPPPTMLSTTTPTPPAPQLLLPPVGREALLPKPSPALPSEPHPAVLPFLPQYSPYTTPAVIFPPNLVCDTLPPANPSPAVFPPANHLPEHINQPHFSNLLNTSTPRLDNTAQKSKTRPRARCLQVIETKQCG